jgi:hypothetical protein
VTTPGKHDVNVSRQVALEQEGEPVYTTRTLTLLSSGKRTHLKSSGGDTGGPWPTLLSSFLLGLARIQPTRRNYPMIAHSPGYYTESSPSSAIAYTQDDLTFSQIFI